MGQGRVKGVFVFVGLFYLKVEHFFADFVQNDHYRGFFFPETRDELDVEMSLFFFLASQVTVKKTVQINVLVFRHKRPYRTASLSRLTFFAFFAFFLGFQLLFLLKKQLKTGQFVY